MHRLLATLTVVVAVTAGCTFEPDATPGERPTTTAPDTAAGTGRAAPRADTGTAPSTTALTAESGPPRVAPTTTAVTAADTDPAPRTAPTPRVAPTLPTGPAPAPGPLQPPAPTAPERSRTGTVTRVVDGDTYDIDISGTTVRVRAIGYDTPETVRPGAPVDCYGPEASTYAKSLLTGRAVTVDDDPLVADVDAYGRTLAHVRLDGTLVGETMITGGYAREYTYRNQTYTHQGTYRAAQAAAQANRAGLWGAC
jgi:micrococcal nuclease